MDRLREDGEQTELAKEIGDESTGSALYNQHCGGYGKRGGRGNKQGRGRGNMGKDHGGNKNDDREYSCTHCKMNNHTTESCGILKRLKSGTGGLIRKKSEEVL